VNSRSTWRSRNTGRPAPLLSQRGNAHNSNRVILHVGSTACRATQGDGSKSTRLAKRIHGQSWPIALRADGVRRCWSVSNDKGDGTQGRRESRNRQRGKRNAEPKPKAKQAENKEPIPGETRIRSVDTSVPGLRRHARKGRRQYVLTGEKPLSASQVASLLLEWEMNRDREDQNRTIAEIMRRMETSPTCAEEGEEIARVRRSPFSSRYPGGGVAGKGGADA
jgi:hypothetical protein